MIINKIEFPIYGIILLISFVCGIFFNYSFLKKNNIKKQYCILFISMITLFATIGGVMLSTIFTKESSFKPQIRGLSSYGGAIGTIIAAIIFEKIYPKDNVFIKGAILSLPLIYSISKLACFFTGCCSGLPCKNTIFSVTYTSGSNTPLIPIQLIETIVFIGIFIFCFLQRNRRNIASITVLICALSKFILDFFRNTHLKEDISKNQIISIIFIAISIFTIIKKCNKKIVFKEENISRNKEN